MKTFRHLEKQQQSISALQIGPSSKLPLLHFMKVGDSRRRSRGLATSRHNARGLKTSCSCSSRGSLPLKETIKHIVGLPVGILAFIHDFIFAKVVPRGGTKGESGQAPPPWPSLPPLNLFLTISHSSASQIDFLSPLSPPPGQGQRGPSRGAGR